MTTQLLTNETFDTQGQLIATETVATPAPGPDSDSVLLDLIQSLGESEKNKILQVLAAAQGGTV